MGDTDITLWLNIHRMEALEEQLELEGSSVEKHLQDYLIDLYSEMVPFEEQQRINDLIAAEQKADEEAREAQRRFSVFRVRENAKETLFLSGGDMDTLRTADKLQEYAKIQKIDRRREVRESVKVSKGFDFLFSKYQPITEQQFRDAVEERQDNTGRVVGAYEIDLDKGEFSTLTIMSGWKTFYVKDVCAAAYHAMRKDRIPWDDRWARFFSALEGRELTGATMVQEAKGTQRLKPEEMFFDDEIVECVGKLSFYMPNFFDTEKVFGLPIDDTHSVNVYASYDMDRQCADTALNVFSMDEDDQEVSYRYLLTKAEREVLTEKMEDYCQQRYGQSLEEFCREQREEMSDPQFDLM